MSFDNEANVKKGLSFLFLSIGLFIFAAFVLTKVDIEYKKVQAETQKLSADLDWHHFLYKKNLQEMVRNSANDDFSF